MTAAVAGFVMVGGVGPIMSVAPRVIEPTPSVRLSISVFSGRPNPGWAFDKTADLEKLGSLLADLPPTPPVEEPPFGRTPVFYLEASRMKPSFPAYVAVFDGVVRTTSRNGDVRFFSDAKGLPKWLREEAVRRGLSEFVRDN